MTLMLVAAGFLSLLWLTQTLVRRTWTIVRTRDDMAMIMPGRLGDAPA